MMHFRSRNKQPLKPGAMIQGYSIDGLADFIWLYLRNYTPVNESVPKVYDVGRNASRRPLWTLWRSWDFETLPENVHALGENGNKLPVNDQRL